MTPSFVVATPSRSVCDDNARALQQAGALRLYCLGGRRGTRGIDPALTRLWPWFGAINFIGSKLFGSFRFEPWRFRLHPAFDRWVCRQLRPGDHLISSYGYANAAFRWVRQHGGKTFLDGGNSHPDNFWQILTEEHERWGVKAPPVARHHYERSLAMMADVDFILSPSSFVSRSFLDRGFQPTQMIPNVYPLDLACFQPRTDPRPSDRPLTLINTGSLSLRKGTPYLLEAYRLIRRQIPDARLLVTNLVSESIRPILERNRDLPLEWAPPLSAPELCRRLQSADIFILPSLEDGFARTVTEALACGLPVITTPNTGASDCVEEGTSGSVVPIRDPEALAAATLHWWNRLRQESSDPPPSLLDPARFSFPTFASTFLQALRERGLLS